MSKSRFEVYTELVDCIWEKHGELQTMMLEAFGATTRKCNVELLKEYRAFIIPNNMYLINLFGGDVLTPGLALYNQGNCRFNRRLCIPIYGFDNRVHGFVGYDDGSECKTEDEKATYVPYLYLDRMAFDKAKHMLITPDEYRKAIDKGYICLVDGIFDKISCEALGIPTVSLLGSRLTRYHRAYLKYIKNWVVLADNDNAGNLLTNACKRANPNTVRLSFHKTKDIDEYIQTQKQGSIHLIDGLKQVKQMGYNVDWTIG